MKIVSVQDISCYGTCSLTAAMPILAARGVETAILPSAILSNHTGGFSGFTCLDLTGEMEKIIDRWEREGITFDAIYTGYIGDAAQFALIRRLKGLLSKNGKLMVDPAMADHGKLYKALSPEIVAGMRDLVREADLILPNLTEAAFLLDRPWREDYTQEEIEEITKALSALGPRRVILTGVSFAEDRIGAAAYDREQDSFCVYQTQKVGRPYHGTGDIFAAMAISSLLREESMEEAIRTACLFVARAIEKTQEDPEHWYGVKFEQVLAEKGWT